MYEPFGSESTLDDIPEMVESSRVIKTRVIETPKTRYIDSFDSLRLERLATSIHSIHQDSKDSPHRFIRFIKTRKTRYIDSFDSLRLERLVWRVKSNTSHVTRPTSIVPCCPEITPPLLTCNIFSKMMLGT